MTNDIERSNRRLTLKGWHIVLAVFLTLVTLIVLYFLVQKNRTEERLRALRAAGYPTSFAELAEYTKLPAGVENAAEVYRHAFDVSVRPGDDPNVPGLGTGQWPGRGVRLPEPMRQAIAKCLADNQQCLALLHEAGGIEHCRYDPDYPQIALHGPAVRYGARLLNVSAVYHADQGETEAALAGIHDGLRIADSLQKEPALVNHLMRIACIGLTLSGLERGLSRTAFTESQLQRLSGAVMRTGGTLDFTQALITERCFLIEACRNPALLGQSGQSPPVRMVPGLRTTRLGDTLDFMAEYIEAARLPPPERLARFREIENEIKRLSSLHVMTKMTAPGLIRVGELDVRTRAHLDLAKTAVALERYRLATGRLPGQLAELVPQYLEHVPSDPFDGRPIRYRRTDPGYLLYTVDTDGQDNGGQERDEVPKGQPYDQCFHVTR